MEIRPAEISEILKKQIAAFDTEANVAETGQVLSVGDGIARVFGLQNVHVRRDGRVPRRRPARHGAEPGNRQCRRGDLRRRPADPRGRHRRAHRLASSTCRWATACSAAWWTGSAIRSTARARSSPPSAARVEVKAPGIIPRKSVHEPVQTGLKAIDALIPIGRGQRELIIGDRQTGKTAVIIDTIINQKTINAGGDEMQEAVLHLRRDRPEALHGGAARADAGGIRRDGILHRGRRHRVRSGADAVPGALHRLHHGRVFPRQRPPRGDLLRRSVQAGGRVSPDVAAAAPPAGPRGVSRATCSICIRACWNARRR